MTKSRWANWSRGTEDKVGFNSFMEAIDSGNPSGTGTVSPAERARQLGLQSNGSGGYTDESGNIVARTVNNELVFYDQRGATGGVVSDGAGGQQLATAQPSWSDPKTGMLTTPPAQPESPEELAAVPDATPSVAPMGYNAFMKKKKEQAYANPEPEEQENPGEMGGGIPQMSGMMGDGDMGVGDAGGMMGEELTYEKLTEKAAPIKKSFDPNLIDPKIAAQSKVRRDDAAKRRALSIDRAAGNVRDDFQDGRTQPTNTAPKPMVQQSKKPAEIVEPVRSPVANQQTSPLPQLREPVEPQEQREVLQAMDNDVRSMDNNIHQGVVQSKEMSTFDRGMKDIEDNLTSGWDQRWKTQKKRDNARKEMFEPLQQLLSGLDEGDDRDRLVSTLMRAYTHGGGRSNTSSKTMSGDEIRGLQEKMETLRDIDGSKSGEEVPNIDRTRDFVKSVQSLDISDELVDTSWNALPPKVQAALSKGVEDWGYDPKSGWKKYLQQGGVDAYTGLPLDPFKANWEHVIADTKSNISDDHSKFINSLENMVWISESVNQRKSNDSMEEFFSSKVDTYDPLKDGVIGFHETYGKPMDDRLGQFDKDNYAQLFTESNGGSERHMRDDMTEEMLDDLLSTHDNEYSQIRDSILPELNKLDPTGKFEGLKDKRAITKALKNGDITEEEAKTMSYLHQARQSIQNFKPALKYLLSSMTAQRGNTNQSIPYNLSHNPKRGSGLGKQADKLIEASLRSMARMQPEKRQEFANAWAEGSNSSKKFSSGQESKLRDLRGTKDTKLGYQENEYRVQSMFYDAIRDMMDPEVMARPEFADLVEDMEMYNGSEDNLKEYQDALGSMIDENPSAKIYRSYDAWRKGRRDRMKNESTFSNFMSKAQDSGLDDVEDNSTTDVFDVNYALRQLFEHLGQSFDKNPSMMGEEVYSYDNESLRKRINPETKPEVKPQKTFADMRKELNTPQPQVQDEPMRGLHKINSGEKDTRIDMASGSPRKNRGENATIEAMSAMHHDGIEGEELDERIGRHFQDTRDGVYTAKEKREKMDGAKRAAMSILEHFDGGQGNDIRFGSMEGQHSDVDDINRSNIYLDIYNQLFSTIGKRQKNIDGTPKGPRGREWNEDELVKLGKRLYTDAVQGEDSTSSEIVAGMSPTDIYLSRGDKEEEMRKQFSDLSEMFLSDNDAAFSPGAYGMLVSNLLQRKGNDKELMGYSLKDIVAGKPIHLQESNLAGDRFTQIVGAMLNGDVDLRTAFDNKGKLKRNFNFDSVIKALHPDMDENEEPEAADAKFASSTATRPSMFKIEPFGFGAKLGIQPSGLAKRMIQDYTGEDINDNISYTREDGTPTGSNLASIVNARNYNDEEKTYWQEQIQDLIDNPSERFNIGNSPFINFQGEEVEGKEWIKQLIDGYNLSEEDYDSSSGRNRADYRTDVLSFLRNMRVFKMFRNADRDGKFNDIMGQIIGNSSKINTNYEDLFFPFTKIASDMS